MSRAGAIRTQLRAAIYNLHCIPAAVTRQDWDGYDLPSRYRFGWLPPIPLTEGPEAGTYTVAFCPELLDEITKDLPDTQLEVYLTVLETLICYQLQDPAEPPDNAYRRAEDDMSRTPNTNATLMLYNHTNLSALDRWS